MRLRKKKSLIDQAIDQASDYVDAVRPAIESAAATAKEQFIEQMGNAREYAKDTARDAKDKAGPLLADGRVRAGEIASATAEVAIPKARMGADKAAELALSGRDYAAAKVAEVKGEPQPTKGQKVRKLLLFGSLVAIGGFVVNKLRGRKDADNWQSSYVPPSTTSSTTSSKPTTGTHLAPGVGSDAVGTDDPASRLASDGGETPNDAAGASPDEAIADAAEEPQPVTTPDDPADVVDVKTDGTTKS